VTALSRPLALLLAVRPARRLRRPARPVRPGLGPGPRRGHRRRRAAGGRGGQASARRSDRAVERGARAQGGRSAPTRDGLRLRALHQTLERCSPRSRSTGPRRCPASFGVEFTPPSRYVYYRPRRARVPRCGSEQAPAKNAFYCPAGDFIAWDESGLVIPYYVQAGDFAAAFVLAQRVRPRDAGTAAAARAVDRAVRAAGRLLRPGVGRLRLAAGPAGGRRPRRGDLRRALGHATVPARRSPTRGRTGRGSSEPVPSRTATGTAPAPARPPRPRSGWSRPRGDPQVAALWPSRRAPMANRWRATVVSPGETSGDAPATVRLRRAARGRCRRGVPRRGRVLRPPAARPRRHRRPGLRAAAAHRRAVPRGRHRPRLVRRRGTPVDASCASACRPQRPRRRRGRAGSASTSATSPTATSRARCPSPGPSCTTRRCCGSTSGWPSATTRRCCCTTCSAPAPRRTSCRRSTSSTCCSCRCRSARRWCGGATSASAPGTSRRCA
jgi:hypothetical protein